MSKNISDEDLKIWEEFTKNMNNIENKDIVYDKENFYTVESFNYLITNELFRGKKIRKRLYL